jgi:iron complex outermembrane receptor protein
VYGFVATGNTTGGSSVVAGVPNFDNQASTDFEAGWKGILFEGRMLTQFGGFYTVIDDYQASFAAVIDSTVTPPLLSSTFQNLDGKTKTWGIELQAQSQFGNLGVDFNAAWIHSELGDDLIFDTTLQQFIQTGGNQIPWTPEYTFNVGVQYDFHLGNGMLLTPRVTYSWIDEQIVTATDRVVGGVYIDRIFDHDMVNVQVNLEMDQWRIQAFMTNALEEEYIQAHSGSPAHPDAYANEPRRYGLRVTWDFGS